MTESKILDGPALFQMYFEEVLLRFVTTPGVSSLEAADALYQQLKTEKFAAHFEQALNFMTAVLQGESVITKILETEGVTFELGEQLQGDLHSQQLKSEFTLPWATFSILSDEMKTSYLTGLARWFALGEERPVLPQIPRD